MKVLCVIPARGGSKGVKNKNIMDLAGKSLIGHTIESAMNAKLVNHVVVSTDSQVITDVVLRDYDIEVIKRPDEFALDNSPIEEALLHSFNFMKENRDFDADIVVWLQANVPFRPEGLIDEVVQKLIDTHSDSCVTCYEAEQRPELMKVVNEEQQLEAIHKDIYAIRRQELPKRYLLDGSVVALKAQNLVDTYGIRKLHVYLCNKVAFVEQAQKMHTLEIDTQEDVLLANFYADLESKKDSEYLKIRRGYVDEVLFAMYYADYTTGTGF